MHRLLTAYTETARFLLSTGIAFLAANLLALPLVAWLETDPTTARYGADLVALAYPDLTPEDAAQLLAETWSATPIYRPFTETADRPRRGRFVNVRPEGFRESADQGPWPPDPARRNVFCFGGSTTFGHGVADADTVPSRLQARLRDLAGETVTVYNFGSAAFYSSQGRALLGELLAAGHRPELAVFIDGLNDFYMDEPHFANRLRRLMEERPAVLAGRLARRLPLIELARDLAARARGPGEGPAIDPAFDRPEVLEKRIDRYLANVRQVDVLASGYGVTAVFVVQPVPVYRYDLDHHPFARWGFDQVSYAAYGYPRLRQRLESRPPAARMVWSADVQEGLSELLYVDQVHYNARLADLVAADVVRAIRDHGWLDAGP